MVRTKLVYLIGSLRIGGAQSGMFRLVRNLDPDEYDLIVITVNAGVEDPQSLLPDYCDFIDLGISNFYKLYRIRKLWDSLYGSDVLVCSLMEATIIGRIVGALRPSCQIIDWRHNSDFMNWRVWLLFNITSWIPDVIIVDSRQVLKSVVKQPGVFSSKVQHVPIAGIDINEFNPIQRSKTENIRVLSVMRLSEEKNPWAVIELAKRFADDESVIFEVAGDGPLLEGLKNHIRDKELENIRFRGLIRDIPSFLSRGTIYIQPSKSEGLCITVPEAMACELPVIASAVGGIPESVIEGETGYLLKPQDLDGFEDRIRFLIEHPEKRRKLGANGRKRVDEHYSIERLTKGFEKVLSTEVGL